MARDDPQMKIRLPEELKGRIEQSAAAASRSLNAEIVHRLEQSFVLLDQIESLAERSEARLKAADLFKRRAIDVEQRAAQQIGELKLQLAKAQQVAYAAALGDMQRTDSEVEMLQAQIASVKASAATVQSSIEEKLLEKEQALSSGAEMDELRARWLDKQIEALKRHHEALQVQLQKLHGVARSVELVEKRQKAIQRVESLLQSLELLARAPQEIQSRSTAAVESEAAADYAGQAPLDATSAEERPQDLRSSVDTSQNLESKVGAKAVAGDGERQARQDSFLIPATDIWPGIRVTKAPDGTVGVRTGDAPRVRWLLAEEGITQVVDTDAGLVISASEANKALAYFLQLLKARSAGFRP